MWSQPIPTTSTFTLILQSRRLSPKEAKQYAQGYHVGKAGPTDRAQVWGHHGALPISTARAAPEASLEIVSGGQHKC